MHGTPPYGNAYSFSLSSFFVILQVQRSAHDVLKHANETQEALKSAIMDKVGISRLLGYSHIVSVYYRLTSNVLFYSTNQSNVSI